MAKNTYVAVGNKEDISDLITNIAPKDTPVFSTIGSTTATAVKHSWLEDNMPSPTKTPRVEGAQRSTGDPDPRVQLDNVTQIFSRGYEVTATQEAVKKHGVESEISYQMQKAMKAVALDVEKAFIEQTTKVVGSASVARELGGIPYFVTTNVLANGGTPRGFTEAILNDALQAVYGAGGSPGVAVMGGKQKRVASGWTAGSTKFMDADATKLQSKISIYESDFGVVKLLLDRWMPAGSVFVLDTQYLKTAWLRRFKTEDLPKTHDSIRKDILGELTLECRAEKAHALIKDLTTT